MSDFKKATTSATTNHNIQNTSRPFQKRPQQNKKFDYRKPIYQKPTQKRLHWTEKLILQKKNPDNKRYFAFYLKTKNNLFITITDVKGRVIISQSAGSCKITTKKKKKSWDTLKAVALSAAKIARVKNIKYIFKFFSTSTYKKTTQLIFESFREAGLSILKAVVFNKTPHALPMRKKKAKRL